MDSKIYNISRMFEHPKCAIRCTNYSDASSLVSALSEIDPSLTEHFKNGNVGWDMAEQTCYTLFYSDSKNAERLSRTRKRWFIDNGYEIIEFADIIMNNADIEESGQPIGFLLS